MMTRGVVLILFVAGLAGEPQNVSTGAIRQSMGGACNASVAGVAGNVSVTINCAGWPPAVRREVNRLLAKKDLTIAEKVKEAESLRKTYIELIERLATSGIQEGLRQKAEHYLQQGRFDKAGELLDEATKATELRLQDAAKAHFLRAQLHTLAYEHEQAVRHYSRAYVLQPDDPQHAISYAHCLHRVGDSRAAETVLNEAVKRFSALVSGNSSRYGPALARLLSNLAGLYGAEYRHEEALSLANRALAIIRPLAEKDEQLFDELVIYLGNTIPLHATSSNYGSAAAVLKEAIAGHERLKRRTSGRSDGNFAELLNRAGVFYLQAGMLEDSERSFRRALEFQRQIVHRRENSPQDDLTLSIILSNEANLYRAAERLQDAKECSEEAETIRRKLYNTYGNEFATALADSVVQVGAVHRSLGSDENWERALKQAIELFGKPEKPNRSAYVGLASAQFDLGNLYSKQARWKEAEHAYLSAAQLQRQIASDAGGGRETLLAVAYTTANLGNLYLDLNRADAALRTFEESLSYARQLLPQHIGPAGEHILGVLFNLISAYGETDAIRARTWCDEWKAVSAKLGPTAASNKFGSHLKVACGWE